MLIALCDGLRVEAESADRMTPATKTAGGSASALIVKAVKTGSPARIAAAVEADPDLQERAANM